MAARETRYEVRIYKWKPEGNSAYDNLKPDHPNFKKSLKFLGFKPYIVARQIPAADISYGWVLDGVGSAEVTIPLEDGSGGDVSAPLQALKGIEPYHYCVAIVHNSQPGQKQENWLVWSGIIWNMHMDLNNRTLKLGARDFMSYYEGRHQSEVQRTPYEQATLVTRVLKKSNENYGINTTYGMVQQTGKKRQWDFAKDQFKEALQSWHDLADNIDGFFITIGSQRNNMGKPTEYLQNTMYVSKDRNPSWATGRDGKRLPPLEAGVNCEIPEIFFDGSQIASVATAVGTGGTFPIQATQVNGALLKRAPMREVAEQFHSISNREPLVARAKSALSFGDPGIRVPRVITYPEAFPDPQRFDPNLGVKIQLKASTGIVDINETYVVTASTVNVDGDGSERVELTLVQESLFRKGEYENG